MAETGISGRHVLITSVVVPAMHACTSSTTRDRVDRFLHLSAQLTGFPKERLDRNLGQSLLENLEQSKFRTALDEALDPQTPVSDDILATAVISAWYSGIHPRGTGSVVATFGDALVYEASGFLRPISVCAGMVGTWSDVPTR